MRLGRARRGHPTSDQADRRRIGNLAMHRLEPGGLRPGEPFTLAADVTNTGATVWLADGRHGRGAVTLGAHLLTAGGDLLDQDYGRAGLQGDIGGGGRAALSLDLRAPREPGQYLVRLDMVNEGIGWFAEGRSQVADITLRVETGANSA